MEKTPKMLPVFKGYTVDLRLRQFRKAVLDETLEFIDFDTEEGEKLLSEMTKQWNSALNAKRR